MQAIDFHNSYLGWRIDWDVLPPETASHTPPWSINDVRIPIESRCRLTEKASGASREFVLGANCKTERVGVSKDIWTRPNADFVPIFTHDRFLILKTYDHVGRRVPAYPPSLGEQPERQTGLSAETFVDVRIDIAEREGTLLANADDVIRAVADNRQLVARTEFENARYVAAIDYPVRTINTNERDGFFQTDTGPLLFPDLSREPDELIEGMELAFSAFNSPDWIEFLVRAPTPLTDDISVWHYARSVRLDCRNTVVRI